MSNKMEYWDRAYRLFKEGKDFYRDLQEAARCELTDCQVGGAIEQVEIVAAKDSCKKCKSLARRRIALNEALKTMPIPVKDCGKGFCRCVYVPVVKGFDGI